MKAFLLTLACATTVHALDWTQRGKDWTDPLCQTGWYQSPVNVDPRQSVQNNIVKFVMDYKSYESLTVTSNTSSGYLGVNLPTPEDSRNNSLVFWNEKGEQFEFFLENYQWKVPSEHTIDNR